METKRIEKVEEEDEEGLCDQGALPAGSGMTNSELSRMSIVCPDAPTFTQTMPIQPPAKIKTIAHCVPAPG